MIGTGPLDRELISICADKDNIEQEFRRYLARKRDFFRPDLIKVPVGVDGVTHRAFENDLKHQLTSLSERLVQGKFFFSPFREVYIPKDPGLSTEQALKKGRVRTISVPCLSDVLVQQLLYRVLEPYAEQKFQELPPVSYGYRKGCSAPRAARRVHRLIREDYRYVLDADIRSFFDEIPHEFLGESLRRFFGEENSLVLTYLSRFFKADRVPWESYGDNVSIFFQKKPQRLHRERGIPQGGAISGLLANVYMHPFDAWAVSRTGSLGDLERAYIRYADDFLFLTKEPQHLDFLQEEAREKLASMQLFLHTDPGKSKKIDLQAERVEYVGFAISPRDLSARSGNVKRFKKTIKTMLKEKEPDGKDPGGVLRELVSSVNYKLLGNEAKGVYYCTRCDGQQPRRNWLAFFGVVTNVNQLRNLDNWIRRAVGDKYYRVTGQRVTPETLSKLNLANLEQLHGRYRREAGEVRFCRCSPELAEFRRQQQGQHGEADVPLVSLLYDDYLSF